DFIVLQPSPRGRIVVRALGRFSGHLSQINLSRNARLLVLPPLEKQRSIPLPLLVKSKMLHNYIVNHKYCACCEVDRFYDFPFRIVRSKSTAGESPTQLQEARMRITVERFPRQRQELLKEGICTKKDIDLLTHCAEISSVCIVPDFLHNLLRTHYYDMGT